MTNRYIPLDLLRGLAIFGMIFSAIIPYGDLPAWMYHIQNPPPTHQLDISVTGIGWVDFVFPLFIFCMGVSIPLAGRRGIVGRGGIAETEVKRSSGADTGAIVEEKREVTNKYVISILKRFLMLWIFSYLYIFVDYSQDYGWQSYIATIIGFMLLFVIYYAFPKEGKLMKYKNKIKMYGWVSMATLIVFGYLRFNEEISLNRGGIIIFLLAFLYLFGSLIWYFTRDNHKHRIFAFIAILLFAAGTMPFGVQPKLYAIPEIRWFFNMEYIYFLLIVIPATYIGDILRQKLLSGCFGTIESEQEQSSRKRERSIQKQKQSSQKTERLIQKQEHLSQRVEQSVGKEESKGWILLWKREIIVALISIIAGFTAMIIEGRVTKVPCTVSYCLITLGVSILLLLLADRMVSWAENSYTVRIFAGAGANPLMSYVSFGSFIMPLMKVTGFIYIYNILYPAGYPWMGVLRAFVFVLLTLALVAKMSENKIFWRA